MSHGQKYSSRTRSLLSDLSQCCCVCPLMQTSLGHIKAHNYLGIAQCAFM